MEATNQTRHNLLTLFLLVVLVVSIINAYYYFKVYTNSDNLESSAGGFVKITGVSGLTAGGALILGILDVVIAVTALVMMIYRYMKHGEDKKHWFSDKFVVFLFLLVLLPVSILSAFYYFGAAADAVIDSMTGSSLTTFDGLSKGGAIALGIVSILVTLMVIILMIFNIFRKQ
jgi:hypothetical protein